MYLIRQNSFDIRCSTQDFGMELQSQLSSLLEKSFYPQLEQLLMKYDVPGTHWIVDELQIELPDIPKKYWKEQLIQKTLAQIEDYLIRNSPKTELSIAELLGNDTHTVPSDIKIASLLFGFLRNGYLEVNAFSDKLEKIMAAMVIDKDFVNQLSELFEANLDALIRWIFSAPGEYKTKALKFLPDTFNGDRFVRTILNHPAFQKGKEKSIAEKLFYNQKYIQQWQELIQWVDHLIRKGVASQKLFSFLSYAIEKFWNVSKAEMALLLDLVLRENSSVDLKVDFFMAWQKQVTDSKGNESTIGISEEMQVEKETGHIQERKTFTDDPVFYVNNAGLVLLHPFLPMLFEKLGLTEKNEWAYEQAKQKAVLLTHFLVFGEQEIEESQLVLNKIMCGLPISEVINTQLVLQIEDKEKCNSLLEAVLEHWTIMRNSSKEALQGTFLQREGKLEIQMNGFEMWMEEKGYDILLEQLPWGINMIRTPWMESYLTCNWNQ
ncbi:contractile injection system tape measure protein [Flavobacterium amniphilum]|uniref:contractile injection system tape measure protein n=1 Tax=Flavobacterium amniphilum TaxID=1834035 RepID=UPI00202A304E|nr:contractile injection system tape measure protein [Flavobacterium amniphilum]MCL9803994.1 contractile injection system tape measure protein [Flavobacterium amniphilum]